MDELRPITDVAEEAGIRPAELELHGSHVAKIDPRILERLTGRPAGRYILVTGTTPTPRGEGKTTVSIGLAQALRHIGENAICTLREPSLGPVFGMKGGATGGGRSRIVPGESINLHFTGDLHAVTSAHNLLAALVDNHLYRRQSPPLSAGGVFWRRVIDMNDRALRRIVVARGGGTGGVERDSGFDITAASEVMAVLTLSADSADLRRRLGRISVGVDGEDRLVTADDLRAAGAMALLLREAIRPNLVQTLEGGPCLVHGGPFANISHGGNSILADRIALALADFVVTEAGFAADCGAEKFHNIKCRLGGLRPSLAVLVTSVRALKHHGGRPARKGETVPPDPEAVRRGAGNLERHLAILRSFGLPVVVAVNRFAADTDAEIETARDEATRLGADAAVPVEVFRRGGEGGADLARAVVEHAGDPIEPDFTYRLEDGVAEKIEAVARTIYGADGIELSPLARRKIDLFEKNGLADLPVCIAKTPMSLSHDPKLLGAPTGFTLPVTDIRPATGAGYLYPLAGKILTMPGLPAEPSAWGMEPE